MMKSFPFTSEVTFDGSGYPQFDRAVDSEVLRKVLKNYYTNGVFALNSSSCFLAKTSTAGGMTVTVSPGVCMINGATAYDEASTDLQLDSGTDQPRIDTIALRLNDNTQYRNISLVVIKGSAEASPKPPALTRAGSIYDLGIANVSVNANTTVLASSAISDTRMDTERCGYVTANQKLDTTNLYNQFQAALDEYLETVRAALDDTSVGLLESKIANLTKTVAITIPASSWPNSTVAMSGMNYYTTTKSVSEVFDACPDVMIGAVGVLPTEAEQKAFNTVSYVTITGTTLKLYAKNKPASDFVIVVKGAK